ncbi:MAG: hypothetical protein H0V66_13385 [Bdellovibrionales bacterium]|nr:hypothetical protein [Bdellovibrionales bacterium]
MKEKLLPHYLKIGPRRFVIGSVIVLVILDLLNGTYLREFWVKNDMSQKNVLMIIARMEAQPTELNPDTLLEVGMLVDQSFAFLLFVILVNNLFFYFFYLRKKLWAQGYILFYTLTAALFSAATLFMKDGMGLGWMTFQLVCIPIYSYLYMGVKLLKAETTLVPEKKGR